MVRTLCFHCRGHGFHLWLEDPHMLCGVAKKKKKPNKQKEGRKNCQINWLASECETYSEFRGSEIWKKKYIKKKLHFILASMKYSDSFLLLICGFMLLDFSVSGVLEGAVTTPWLSTSTGKVASDPLPSPLPVYRCCPSSAHAWGSGACGCVHWVHYQ